MRYKRIELGGHEMTGCATLLVPEFIWRLVGAKISFDVDAINELNQKSTKLTEQMNASIAIQKDLIDKLGLKEKQER